MPHTAFAVAIQALLKACIDGKPQHELVLPVGATPQYLVDFGFPALNMVITGRVVDKAHFDHGITKGLLERLPTVIANPQALYTSTTVPNGAVVATFELKGPEVIVIPVHPDRPFGRAARYNAIASIYAKPRRILLEWDAQGLCKWAQK